MPMFTSGLNGAIHNFHRRTSTHRSWHFRNNVGVDMSSIVTRYIRVDERRVIQVEVHVIPLPAGPHGKSRRSKCYWFKDRHLQEILQLLKDVVLRRVETAIEKGSLSKASTTSPIITGNTVRVGYTFKKKAERQTCLVPSFHLSEDSRNWPEPGPQMSSFYVHCEKLVVFACSIESNSPQGMSQLVQALREGGETSKGGVSISSYFQRLKSASQCSVSGTSITNKDALPPEPASDGKKTAIRNILKRSCRAMSQKRKRKKGNDSDADNKTKCKSETCSLFNADSRQNVTSRKSKLHQPTFSHSASNATTESVNPKLSNDIIALNSKFVHKNTQSENFNIECMERPDCECGECAIEAECKNAQNRKTFLASKECLVGNFSEKNSSLIISTKHYTKASIRSPLVDVHASSSFQKPSEDDAAAKCGSNEEIDVINCDEEVNVNQEMESSDASYDPVSLHKSSEISDKDCRNLLTSCKYYESDQQPGDKGMSSHGLVTETATSTVNSAETHIVLSSVIKPNDFPVFRKENDINDHSKCLPKTSPVFVRMKSRKFTSQESCQGSPMEDSVNTNNKIDCKSVKVCQSMESVEVCNDSEVDLPELKINKMRNRPFKQSSRSSKRNLKTKNKSKDNLSELKSSSPNELFFNKNDRCNFSVQEDNVKSTSRNICVSMIESSCSAACNDGSDLSMENIEHNYDSYKENELPTLQAYSRTCSKKVCDNYELHETKIKNSISEIDLPILKGLQCNKQKKNDIQSVSSKKPCSNEEYVEDLQINPKQLRKSNKNFSDTLPDLDLGSLNQQKHGLLSDDEKNDSGFGMIINMLPGHRLSVSQLLTEMNRDADAEVLDLTCMEEELLDCILVEDVSDMPTVKNEKDMEIRNEIRSMSDVSYLGEKHIHYLVLHNEDCLCKIFQGKTDCERHESYKEGGRSRKNLNYQVHLGMFTDEQHDVVMNTLMSIFCKKHHKYLDYLLKVLLPEMLIKIHMEIHNTTHADTEQLMLDALRQPGAIVDF